jgi:hypothetical protein
MGVAIRGIIREMHNAAQKYCNLIEKERAVGDNALEQNGVWGVG